MLVVREWADQVGVVEVPPCFKIGYEYREPNDRQKQCYLGEGPSSDARLIRGVNVLKYGQDKR